MKTLIEIIKEHILYRSQIWSLAKNDLVKTYKGSVLGWMWAFLKPAINLFVYWFAFSVGLRSGKPVEGYPYFLWLMAGMLPWFYMRAMLTDGARCLRKNAYLITKIKYPMSTIPTFVNISNLLVHLMLVAIMIVIYLAAGYTPDIYYLQLPLYMGMAFLFFNCWALFAGVISAFSRDFLNFIRSISMAFLWLSGIFYSVNSIEIEWLRKMMLFNPITLVVNGYRNVFIYKQWFWEDPVELGCFCVTLVVFTLLALWAYKRLRKEIPDVL